MTSNLSMPLTLAKRPVLMWAASGDLELMLCAPHHDDLPARRWVVVKRRGRWADWDNARYCATQGEACEVFMGWHMEMIAAEVSPG